MGVDVKWMGKDELLSTNTPCGWSASVWCDSGDMTNGHHAVVDGSSEAYPMCSTNPLAYWIEEVHDPRLGVKVSIAFCVSDIIEVVMK